MRSYSMGWMPTEGVSKLYPEYRDPSRDLQVGVGLLRGGERERDSSQRQLLTVWYESASDSESMSHLVGLLPKFSNE